MSRAQWLDKVQRGAIFVAAVLALASLVVGVFVLATGRDTNTLVRGQDEARETAECRSLYASSESAAAVKYRHAQVELIKALGEVPGALSVPEALAFIDETDREQVRYAALRLRSNELCDPPGDGPPVLPPPIDPPEVSQ